MTIGEIAALAAVVISIGTNVGLYVHLSSRLDSVSSTMNSRLDSMNSSINTRFDSVERRLEMLAGLVDKINVRLTRWGR